MAWHLRKFVEEQHSGVGKADLAWPRIGAPSHEGHIGDGVVWTAEGPLEDEGIAAPTPTCHGVNAVDGEGFVQAEGGQQPHHGPGKHGLARSRWTDHAEVVPPSRSEGNGVEAPGLAPDGGQRFECGVGLPRHLFGEVGGQQRQGAGPGQMVHDLPKVVGGEHSDPVEQGGLGGGFPREDDRTDIGGQSRLGEGQSTPDRAKGPVEGQLPHAQDAVDPIEVDLLRSGEDAQGEGKVVGRALLAQAGRGQVDRDALSGPAVTEVLDGTLDALLALPDGTVGQAHHQEVDAPVHPNLHGDGHGIDALEGGGIQSDEHRVRSSGAAHLDVVNEGVDALDVHLLNVVGITRPRDTDLHIAERGEGPSILSGQADDRHSGLFGRLRGADHVGRIPGRRDGQQDIARATHGLHEAREHEFVAVVVADTAQVRRVGNGQSGQGLAVVPVPASEFLGEVHGVAHGASIAAGDHLATGRNGLGHGLGARRNGSETGSVPEESLLDFPGLFEMSADAIGVFHVRKVHGASYGLTGVV